jgi:hypothetical protein
LVDGALNAGDFLSFTMSNARPYQVRAVSVAQPYQVREALSPEP